VLAAKEKYKNEVIGTDVTLLAKAVIKTLLYFDIFNYPLTIDEIYEYCCEYPASKDEILGQLEIFEELGYVSRKDFFYQIRNNKMAASVERRIKGNKEAQRFLKIAKRFTKFITYFPFVRGVCLSGSLSKGYADSDSDIDYFIITEPGRLWIARTSLILFKKLFLFNSHKYFCVNYFIDTNSLEIPDKNLFAATELLSIIPAANADLYERLIVANKWIKEYYPNGTLKTNKYPVAHVNSGFMMRVGEKIFSGRFGDKMDDMCFRATLSVWKRKFNHFKKEEFDLNLRTRKNVSKHHPNGFQLKVMRNFEENVKRFEAEFNISLA
jgi:hypothetical protein